MSAQHAQIAGAIRTDRRHHHVTPLEQQMLETSRVEVSNCVHSEHNRHNPSNFREMPPRVPAMSPYRISLCLTTLGWSERELARRIGRHQTEVRRWMLGSAVIDPNVAEWLTELEQFFREHPAPRLRSMVRPAVEEHHNDQNRYQRPNQAKSAQPAVT